MARLFSAIATPERVPLTGLSGSCWISARQPRVGRETGTLRLCVVMCRYVSYTPPGRLVLVAMDQSPVRALAPRSAPAVVLEEGKRRTPGGKEPATVVPVPFKPVDAAQAAQRAAALLEGQRRARAARLPGRERERAQDHPARDVEPAPRARARGVRARRRRSRSRRTARRAGAARRTRRRPPRSRPRLSTALALPPAAAVSARTHALCSSAFSAAAKSVRSGWRIANACGRFATSGGDGSICAPRTRTSPLGSAPSPSCHISRFSSSTTCAGSPSCFCGFIQPLCYRDEPSSDPAPDPWSRAQRHHHSRSGLRCSPSGDRSR